MPNEIKMVTLEFVREDGSSTGIYWELQEVKDILWALMEAAAHTPDVTQGQFNRWGDIESQLLVMLDNLGVDLDD